MTQQFLLNKAKRTDAGAATDSLPRSYPSMEFENQFNIGDIALLERT
jgi:hypothetical protein